MGGDDGLGGEEGSAVGRRWLGRALRLVAVATAALVGAGIGSFVYVDLSEGPFVGEGASFEREGFDAGACYWSPEATAVDDRLGRAFLAAPLGLALLVAAGFAIAVAWNRSTRGAPVPGRGSASGDAVLAALGSVLLAAVAVGFDHGHAIGARLDPGCVRAGVPGPAITVLAVAVAMAGAVALGIALERRSEGRRRARRPSDVDPIVPDHGNPEFSAFR